VHLKLSDGTPFMVRQQNAAGSGVDVKTGDKAGIAIAAGTPRILMD
jgi:hypothetical protein